MPLEKIKEVFRGTKGPGPKKISNYTWIWAFLIAFFVAGGSISNYISKIIGIETAFQDISSSNDLIAGLLVALGFIALGILSLLRSNLKCLNAIYEQLYNQSFRLDNLYLDQQEAKESKEE